MSAKPSALSPKVTYHRTNNEIEIWNKNKKYKGKKYEINDNGDKLLISLKNTDYMKLRISRGPILITAMEDQYQRIRMVDNIKVNYSAFVGL